MADAGAKHLKEFPALESVDLWGRWSRRLALRVGLLLCAAVAINCSGGGDVEVENPCFFPRSEGPPSERTNRRVLPPRNRRTRQEPRVDAVPGWTLGPRIWLAETAGQAKTIC